MPPSLEDKLKELTLTETSSLERTLFGKEMLKYFSFPSGFRNLNQGSFGTSPTYVRQKQDKLKTLCEQGPDSFIRFLYPKLLENSRAAAAKILHTNIEEIVLVPNAMTGVNTTIRNIVWNTDGRDEILYFEIIYGACGNTIDYISEYNRHLVNPRKIAVTYPLSDADFVQAFKDAIAASRAAGKNPRLAVYDTCSSMPGLRIPFEALTKICKEEGILSLIDGAHGIGHIPLNLSTLDPDFFISNAHKWLHTPRGCAVYRVPLRNQHLIRSTIPTYRFIPQSTFTEGHRNNFPIVGKSEFVAAFEFNGTIDNTNWLVLPDAVRWREEVCGGEEAIISYCISLAKSSGKVVASLLGTEVLENEEGTLTNSPMFNVRLPITFEKNDGEGKEVFLEKADIEVAQDWMLKTLIEEYDTYIPIWIFQGRFWARLSAQVYLDESDFEWAGKTLRELSERVGKVEYVKK